MAYGNSTAAMMMAMLSANQMQQNQQEMLRQLMAQRTKADKEKIKVLSAQKTELLAQLDAQKEAAEKKVVEATTQTEQVQVHEDSNDGGKTLSLWGKIKNIGKGALNTVKGMFCDENGFSLKRTLTTVGTVAAVAALEVVTFGAATPYIIGAGVAMGAAHAGKGIYKVATAKNASEEAAGWQDLGGGAFEIGASVAGARSLRGTKFAGKGKGLAADLRAARNATVETFKGAYKVIKHPFKSGRAVKKYFAEGGEGRANWQKTFKSTNAKENLTAKIKKQYEKKIQEFETKKKNLIEENSKLDAVKDAKKIAKNNEQIKQLNDEITAQQKYQTEISENVSPSVDNAKIKDLTEEINTLIKERNKIDPVKHLKEWNEVQAKIEKKIDVRAYELSKETVAGARSSQINGFKERIKTLKEELKTAKDEKPVTEAAKKLREENIENIKKEIARNEQQIKEVEKFNQVEAQQRAVESAQKKIEINKKTVEKHQTEIDRLTKENEALAKTHTEANDAQILENQKTINEHQTMIDRANAGIAKQETAIAKAKRSLHAANAKAAVKNMSTNSKLIAAANTAALEGVLFGNTVLPTAKEISKVDEATQKQYLEQITKEYEAQKKQIEAAYAQQTKSTSSSNAFGPMALAMLGSMQPSGIDSLALYQSPIPDMF